jgi:nucleoside-diphosphate-sugar epimerase
MKRQWRRVLVVGAGDIGRRVIAAIAARAAVSATTSTRGNRRQLRRLGAVPLSVDLDRRRTLARLPPAWDTLVHCAPPANHGRRDHRTRGLLRALFKVPNRSKSVARAIVYLSTSGVYGDHGGERVTESAPLMASNPRARRRADAERALVRASRRHGARLVILRVPGIYATDRLPLARLRAGTPAILAAEDSFTNHIHAADLAAITVRAMRRAATRARPAMRTYNASDNSDMKMGDYFDLVADAFGLPRPPRMPRDEVARAVSPMLWSFMRESRRLDNTRIKRELRVRFQFPDVAAGVGFSRNML